MRERVASGENVVVLTVQYAAYEHLLCEVGDATATRFAYDGKKLELMSPSSDHEHCNRLLERLIGTLALEWRIEIESAGSTTLKTQAYGAEPDSSFYLANAASFIGKGNLDLSIDPPPDLVIEIDLSRSRIDKRLIFSAMKIAEFWRYDGTVLEAFRLDDRRCKAIDVSLAIPNLPIQQLGRFREMRSEMSQSDITHAWRDWLLKLGDRLSDISLQPLHLTNLRSSSSKRSSTARALVNVLRSVQMLDEGAGDKPGSPFCGKSARPLNDDVLFYESLVLTIVYDTGDRTDRLPSRAIAKATASLTACTERTQITRILILRMQKQ